MDASNEIEKRPISFGMMLLISFALIMLGFVIFSMPFELGINNIFGLIFPLSWFWICTLSFRWLNNRYTEEYLPRWSLSFEANYLIWLWLSWMATFGFVLMIIFGFINK